MYEKVGPSKKKKKHENLYAKLHHWRTELVDPQARTLCVSAQIGVCGTARQKVLQVWYCMESLKKHAPVLLWYFGRSTKFSVIGFSLLLQVFCHYFLFVCFSSGFLFFLPFFTVTAVCIFLLFYNIASCFLSGYFLCFPLFYVHELHYNYMMNVFTITWWFFCNYVYFKNTR